MAHILCPEDKTDGRQPLGIKVGTSPDEIRGCFISKRDEQVYSAGLQIGDR